MDHFAEKVMAGKGPAIYSTGQAGYILKNNSGNLLAIDLYLSDCVERFEGHKGFKRLLPKILEPTELKFNVLICTHPHLDHFDLDSIPEMIHEGCKLLISLDCEKLIRQLHLDYYKDQIIYVKPGDHYLFCDFDITFVNCDHGQGAPDAVGVVVKFDGKTVYEVGDSCLRLDRITEISQPVDVMISPINGMYGNMNHEDTIELADALNPNLTIPCHYGMFASHGGDLKAFYDMATKKELPILIMQQGEEYSL